MIFTFVYNTENVKVTLSVFLLVLTYLNRIQYYISFIAVGEDSILGNGGSSNCNN